ncbi:YeeE/YedE thiosulfate transporter family protein [Desulfatitalea alkaliphila]|uniref:YeeE/YedE family protein n=1 Tax=Desulfatitalea alkaliphila TaxID=2929485 RepID=A0AA41R0K4_9BACT|nr:YeeE/YedE thiosulfate transporter family protein [Desulfatitalea alkaliphila]MCJ8499015.1 YeeE/YedE family protein [Desulfatitalea alkaliphila]
MEKKNISTAYWPWLPAAFALAGIIVFIFATFGPPASSSGFVSTIKGAVQTVAPEYVENKTHYAMMPDTGSWLFAFVLGMAMGGFIAGRTGRIPVRDIPEIWEKRFDSSRTRRFAATFVGGFIILFAARLAGGCTLGLFISGSSQLAVSGLYFGALIFAFAMVTARLVYGRTGKEE